MDKYYELNSFELAEYVGNCWGGNSDEFIKCFSENALIDHPFFSEPVSPKIAMEVMNSTCRVNTKYNKSTLIEGDGRGEKDVIRMEFIETGNCAGYVPQYAGNMIVDAWIEKHRFVKFKVYGYDVLKNSVQSTYIHSSEKYKFLSIDRLFNDIADSWMNNDMRKFISIFSDDAKIYHPIISKPATPVEVADIINSGTKGVSVPKRFRIVKGDGTGKKDVVDLYFEETGEELGYIPDTSGLMHVTITLSDGLISEMLVHGYTPIKNSIGEKIANRLVNEMQKEGSL